MTQKLSELNSLNRNKKKKEDKNNTGNKILRNINNT